MKDLPLLHGLKLHVIDSPYDVSVDSEAFALLSQVFQLKLDGYRGTYSDGVLPLDTYDFFATHLIVTRSEGEARQPVMAFKNVTLDRCMRHNLPFPGMSVLKSSGADRHARVLQEFLDRYKNEAHRVSYGSSWTILPELRKDLETKAFLKDLFIAMLVLHEAEIGTRERVTCGGLKVKTDQFFARLGYGRLSEGGEALPVFRQASLIGDEAVILKSSGFSDEALAIAERFRMLWRARIVHSAETLSKRAISRKFA